MRKARIRTATSSNSVRRCRSGASLLLSAGHYRKVADSDGNADSYGIRFDYPLSKRTVLYTGAAMVRNGAHARFVVNGAAGGGVAVAAAGATASSLVAGIVTSF